MTVSNAATTAWGSRMVLRWGCGVGVTVAPDGWLVLCCEATGEVYRYPPPFTVAWISLRRHRGNARLAADEIAVSWHADRAEILEFIDRWLDELLTAGLVRQGC
ncbi:hypothetical protein ACF08N_34825 [Streptomyces sp. NPDC015127]|uniref:hypothetical protein n=1 Tax=Streptomyces sp. NPDC015127 TaxID=3364939 RepID=UPI0036F764F8